MAVTIAPRTPGDTNSMRPRADEDVDEDEDVQRLSDYWKARRQGSAGHHGESGRVG